MWISYFKIVEENELDIVDYSVAYYNNSGSMILALKLIYLWLSLLFFKCKSLF